MSIETMKQALEALKVYGSHAANCDHLMLLTSLPPKRKPCSCGLVATIQALRQAIEQAEQAQPVAWYDPKVMNEDRGISWTPGQFHTAPLYTAPPPRQPLTHPQIHELDWPDGVAFEDILLFVRAIEAAHGIKGEA